MKKVDSTTQNRAYQKCRVLLKPRVVVFCEMAGLVGTRVWMATVAFTCPSVWPPECTVPYAWTMLPTPRNCSVGMNFIMTVSMSGYKPSRHVPTAVQ